MSDNSSNNDLEQLQATNTLIGEFLLSFSKAPRHIQEKIIFSALKDFKPLEGSLIQPYTMLNHLAELIESGKINVE